jgi:hypothetical protein
MVLPECGINTGIGIKGNPEIVHDPCIEKLGMKVFFVRDDGLTHVIYESPVEFIIDKSAKGVSDGQTGNDGQGRRL